MAAAQLCFFYAVQHLAVGVALLLEYLGILLVVGWMWLRHGQVPGRLTIAGGLLALVGLVLVLDLTQAGGLSVVGVLLGLRAPHSAWPPTTCCRRRSIPSCRR